MQNDRKVNVVIVGLGFGAEFIPSMQFVGETVKNSIRWAMHNDLFL